MKKYNQWMDTEKKLQTHFSFYSIMVILMKLKIIHFNDQNGGITSIPCSSILVMT